MYVFQLPCWKNVPSLLFKVLTAHFQADSGNDFAPATPASMYVLLLYRKPAGGSSRHTRQQKDQKHVHNGCPEPVHDSDGSPVRRPGRRRGVVGRASPAVRVAGRRRALRRLPLLQPLRLLRLHRPVLRRRLPEPVRRLRRPRRRQRGVRAAEGPLRAAPPPPQRRRVPRARLLHLRRLPRRRGRLPGLRHDGRRRAAEARGRRVPGPDLPRDHRRMAGRPRRALLVGLLLQAGALPAVRLLRPAAGVAVRPRQEVLRPRPHPALLQLQLRAGGEGHRGGPPEQPGPGGDGPRGVLQDGAVVLDDGAGQQAVVPRRDHGAVGAHGRGQGGRPGRAGLRRGHQRHQRRARVRARRGPAGRRPHRVLQALLRRLPHRLRERRPRLRRPEAVQRRGCGRRRPGGAVSALPRAWIGEGTTTRARSSV